MKRTCPNKDCAAPEFTVKDGSFSRKDDSKIIQRFRCKSCGQRFSAATTSPFYWQKRRRINSSVNDFLSSGVSLRRCAILLKVNVKTITRKLPILAQRARELHEEELLKLKGKVFNIQMDDLITIEHTKLKPLSVSVAVDEDRRTILGVQVSQIPAFGHLAAPSVKKYGKRKNDLLKGLDALFKSVGEVAAEESIIKTDMHKFYPGVIQKYMPRAKHLCFESEPACVAGQGELKKVAFDPLFTINHTLAMLRANLNRLVRKTWCTTKDPQRLKDHLDIFVHYYNQVLLAT
jgi:transposase-like protein